jgi:hypothetical protein
MSRPIHETTPSGDEVRLEANAQLCTRGRTVAQVEHNAMQALDLVRATLTALHDVAAWLDRIGLLLSHSRGAVESAISLELERVIAQLGESIQAALLRDDPLLRGGGAAFAVQDPQDMSSAPLRVDLPDLSHAYSELAEIDLSSDGSSRMISQRQAALVTLIQGARKQLTTTSQELSGVLASQRPPSPVPARVGDEGFVAMIRDLRQSVLHAGDAALRVQGSPTARATWLIEALKPTL